MVQSSHTYQQNNLETTTLRGVNDPHKRTFKTQSKLSLKIHFRGINNVKERHIS